MVKEELENDPSYALLSTQSKRSARQMAVYRIQGESWAMESNNVKAEVQKVYDQGQKSSSDEEDDVEGNDEDTDEKILLQHQQE